MDSIQKIGALCGIADRTLFTEWFCTAPTAAALCDSQYIDREYGSLLLHITTVGARSIVTVMSVIVAAVITSSIHH
jgi:hypothetical protein